MKAGSKGYCIAPCRGFTKYLHINKSPLGDLGVNDVKCVFDTAPSFRQVLIHYFSNGSDDLL